MKRYFATNENGKGYIYDLLFSTKVPCAVEKTYEEAVKMVNIFHKMEEEDIQEMQDQLAVIPGRERLEEFSKRCMEEFLKNEYK